MAFRFRWMRSVRTDIYVAIPRAGCRSDLAGAGLPRADATGIP
jgi:hypothetical protein